MTATTDGLRPLTTCPECEARLYPAVDLTETPEQRQARHDATDCTYKVLATTRHDVVETLTTTVRTPGEDLTAADLAAATDLIRQAGHPEDVALTVTPQEFSHQIEARTVRHHTPGRAVAAPGMADLTNLSVEGLAALLHRFVGTLGAVDYHPSGCSTCSAAWALAEYIGLPVGPTPAHFAGMPTELRHASDTLSKGAERMVDAARAIEAAQA